MLDRIDTELRLAAAAYSPTSKTGARATLSAHRVRNVGPMGTIALSRFQPFTILLRTLISAWTPL